jgi:WS/DGAT/MGAT family acyltransferase
MAPPQPRAHPVRELTIGLATFAFYIVVEQLGGHGRTAAAEDNGRALLAAEHRLGVPVEVWLNSWIVPHQRLRVLANYEYAFTYLVTAMVVLVWLYWRRPEAYRWARTSFVLMNILGLACFALYPVTPPRLLGDASFVDTVASDGTWGSWGSPMVNHANQLAAMPSLHIAWAVWVSVVLAGITSRWWLQGLSAAHITVTALVILATANHYLLDAAGGVLLVGLTVVLMSLGWDQPGSVRSPRVAGADAFFLAVDSPTSVQQVGGLVVADAPAAGYRDRVRAVVEAHLDGFPRLRQRLSPASRWRRPRWLRQSTVDLDWHIPAVTLPGGGLGAVRDLVARLQLTPLPRDRPLWRFVVVTGFAPEKAAVVLIVHHTVADGVATIAQALTWLDGPASASNNSGPAAGGADGAAPGAGRQAVATAAGLVQLATDGANRHPLPAGPGEDRGYATLSIPLRTVRSIARIGDVRVTDVLLTVVAGAVRRLFPAPPAVRTAVPVAMRLPGATEEGNVTAAVMVDLPCGDMPEVERLGAVSRRSGRLRSGTRAVGARFVMRTVCTLLPPVALGWFARASYGRRTFSAIVSNLPGPTGEYRLAGARVEQVYPILPLAPGAPLAVGAIGWDATLFVGASVDPALFPDAGRFADAARAALADLIADLLATRATATPASVAPVSPALANSSDGVDGVAAAARVDGRLQARARTSRARTSGASNVDPNSR